MKAKGFVAATAVVALTTSSAFAAECASTTAARVSKRVHVATTVAERPAQAADIVDTAVSAGSFKTLVAAAKAADLVETLKGKGPFTVFAPTDEAFAKLPEGTVASLLKPENKAKLQAVLKYHVVPAKVMAEQAVKLSHAGTVLGQQLDLEVKEGALYVDGAKVVKADIAASNGVIHVVDKVMLPTEKSIVEIAAGNDSFSTLVAAVKAAGLVETLSGKGPFTVFAPTDEAFAQLPEGTVQSLLKPENRDKLVAILTYHVVPGRVFASDVVKVSSAETANGDTIAVRATDSGVQINEANVVATDIDAANGVIHVIDRVLLP